METIVLTVFANGIDVVIDTGRYRLPCGFFRNWCDLFAAVAIDKDTMPIVIRQRGELAL